jgi:hypothetical protein
VFPFLCASLLLALDLSAPHAHAVRTTQAPTIDGHLDDEAWKAALVSDTFTQQYPDEAKPAAEHTSMRVLYDDEALYIGFELEQVHSPILGHLTRRDHDSESEWISVQIDTRGDGKSVYTFGVNVEGVVVDAIVSEPSVWNFDWDEVWEARTSRTATGWAAEFKIPLRVLRYDAAAPVQSWRLQSIRYIAHLQEFDQWSFIHRDVANPLTHLGYLDDLSNLKAGGAFELRPFVTGRLSRLDATDQTSASGFDASASAGLDLKWHIAQDLTLDAAVLPDFAQVEADQLILNLSNFETFLPEKRPLFLEGTEVFAFPLQVFYSRRIGNAPTAPTLNDDLTLKLVNVPSPAQIYGAGKLVGHLGPHWTIGALTALTGRNAVTTETTAGMRTSRLAAPMRASEVLRLKRDWGSTGHLGLVGTATTSFDGGEGYPAAAGGLQLCPSGDATALGARCFRDSYVGGIDGLWRSPSGDYVANGAFIESFVHGGLAATQLDGTRIGDGARGSGGWARVAKEGGRLLASTQYTGAGRRLDYNDLGYMQRQNQHEVKASVGYRTLERGTMTIETSSAFEVTERRSVNGLDLGQIYELNSRLHFLNYWSAFVAADVAPPRYDDREVGDGTALERGAYAAGRLDLSTDPKHRVIFDVSGSGQAIQHGAIGLSLQGTLTLNLLPQLEIALSPQVTRTTGEARFAWQQGGGLDPNEYVFGQLAATSVGATLRASYTFSPRVSLQTYAQGFLASASYTDRRAVTARPGDHISIDQVRAAPLATMLPAGTVTPDLEEAALNLNVVFRWEYLPGSTLFVVYSRSQIPGVNIFDMGAHLAPRALGRGSSADVILLKLTYWWAS